jgi:hypothetical protein
LLNILERSLALLNYKLVFIFNHLLLIKVLYVNNLLSISSQVYPLTINLVSTLAFSENE